MMARPERIEIENVLQSGKTYRVEAGKFTAMRDAMLAVLPAEAPGLTPSEIKAAVLSRLPEELFPGGDKAGWWIKAVQLDQEAKGVLARSTAPVRLYRV